MRTRRLVAAALALALPLLAGCQVLALPAVMMESYKRTSTHAVAPEYTALAGKSFAVIISADRALQADRPALIPGLTVAVSERLRANVGASGYVPPEIIVEFTSNNPRWTAMSPSELAEELGVERLIYIEVIEFRLHEPGNRHVWDGLASATLGVLETESGMTDEFVFRKDVTVRFPNEKGVTRDDMPESIVAARLQTRLVDRLVWPFYEHQEPYYPEY